MRLTKFTSHAIRILIDCARAGSELTKVAALSSRLQITQQNVFKIVNLLARAGFIEAVRGRNGGVKLARPASAIRIGDVVRATEVTHVEIEDLPHTASRRGREVNRVLDDALEAFIEVLDQHTIADMAKGQTPRPQSPSARSTKKTTPRPASTKAASKVRRTLHDDA